MDIREYKLFRGSYITGPRAVSLGLIFSQGGDHSLRLIPMPYVSGDKNLLDVNSLAAEVRQGVDQANQEFGSNLKVLEIQYVPNDYPGEGLTAFLAYKIAKVALGK